MTVGRPPTNPEPASASGWRSVALRFGAWVMLALSVATAAIGATTWKGSVERQETEALESIERQTAAAVSSQVERVISIMLTMRGVVTASPNMTNPQFVDWYRSSDMAGQAPGALGFTYIQRVPHAALPAFAARQAADPVTGLPADGTFSVASDGVGDEYCLQRLAIWNIDTLATFAIPAGLDMCSATFVGVGPSPLLPTLQEATDSATARVLHGTGLLDTVLDTTFAVMLPVYRDGIVPPTVEGRRTASVGWVGASFDRSLLVAASASSSALVVRVEQLNFDGSVTTVASSGEIPTGDDVREGVVPLLSQGSWQIRVAGRPPAGGGSATDQAIAVFLGGAALGILAFLFMQVLAGARDRALALVELKTGELEFQALHDALTGLPNRALVMDRADHMMDRARRDHRPIAALFIDLDNFKSINDTLGHGAGDELLCAVTERFSGALRSDDTLGRLGGDELVVLVEGESMQAGAEAVAQRLLEVLAEPFVLAGQPTVITASIGIAVGLRETAGDWLRDADVALYERKAAGKNGFVVFEPDMRTVVERRVETEHELRRALDEGQFFLVYQPTFDLQTNVPTGVEALIRWRHPTRGTVAPDDFLPVAEDSGLIVPIGHWVLHEACRQAVEWGRAGHQLLMSVNVSARQLDDEQFVDDVRLTLAATGLEPTSLVLEITETTLMRDVTTTQLRLDALKALGVRIAIDDFGTGYSSLTYLRRFPVDTIKIDRSFISGMASTGEGSALMHTLIQLGKTLGFETLAEGIEEDAQLNQLRGEQCDFGQGFLYAKPLEPAALETFLEIQNAMKTVPTA